MNQAFANRICENYQSLTGIRCKAVFMQMGDNHTPSRLIKGKEQGVYVFIRNETTFKVGKAGTNSQARWNSHHYNLDNSTPSTLTKSFMMDLENFKTFFPVHAKRDIEKINKRQIKNWIQNNMSRIEFKISSKESSIALNLLEALVQFNFPPIYEGKQ
ncbi:hypothetical protein OAH77_04740 [Flavobacteriaceae bacterium]|jgi:hypothetical protein|nr:hypothetical protein [Flavobacteriaceae bacterium]|tara:strand:+ start:712 stop:1185 length:474 start_codon:yes stop_codon:yes gene_type:complete